MTKTYNVVTFTIDGTLLDTAVCMEHDLTACIASHGKGLRLAGHVGEGVAKVLHGFRTEREANFIAFGDERGYQGGNASDPHSRCHRSCTRCGGSGMPHYGHIDQGRCFQCGTWPNGMA